MTMRQLTTMEKLSFGGGDVANCVTFGVTSAYLSYYYTDTVGISVAAVGLILGAARIIEAFANLATGVAIDKYTRGWAGQSLFCMQRPYRSCCFSF